MRKIERGGSVARKCTYMADSISAPFAYLDCEHCRRKASLSRIWMNTSCMQTLVLLFVLLILSSCSVEVLQAQKTGFYSIDCGSSATEIYTDPTSTIVWTPDTGIMTEGLTVMVTAPSAEPGDVFTTLRYFPGNHSKYCYPLSPVVAGNSYIVRASFWIGDRAVYPTQVSGQVSFQLIIDAYVAAEVWVPVPQSSVVYQELYVAANTSTMTACVARTAGVDGADPPFISGLEIRPLPDGTSGARITQRLKLPMLTMGRSNYGVPSTYPGILRYPDDALDRIWYQRKNALSINTTRAVSISSTESPNQVPEKVVQDSLDNVALIYTSVDELKAHFYIHTIFFAEIDPLVDTVGLRVFDVAINGVTQVTGLDVYAQVGAFEAMELVNVTDRTSGWVNTTFTASNGSTYEPFIAGIEVMQVLDEPIPFGTFNNDVVAIEAFVSNLSTISGYKGDPCLPSDYKFPWLSCTDHTPIRISEIDLSNYSLVGSMPTSINDLSELTKISLNANNLQGGIPELGALINLEYLDLSNNKLTGPIPTSLAMLPKLKTLYLQNNDLSGTIPSQLLQKTDFEFKYTGNKNLCETSSKCVTPPQAPSSAPSLVEHTPSSSSSSRMVGVIIGVVVVVIIIVVATFFVFKRCYNPNPNPDPNPDAQIPYAHIFTYQELSLATSNFSHILGRGGFGPVYRGTLRDGRNVAIKVCSQTESQGEAEFKNEARLLSTVHHKNIVQLHGYCEEGILALVYELMPRGSLHDSLFGLHSVTSPLSWIQRLSIMADAAEGLDYLHRQCIKTIVHRDVKSSNILLGHNLVTNLVGKIGDMGISKVNDEATTRMMGTLGYLDPEYAKTLQLTPMVDVFSFGVVLLEVITGRPSVIKNDVGGDIRLVDWVHPLVQSNNLDELVDSRIKGQFNEDAMWNMIEIAMACTMLESHERPHMQDIFKFIKDALQIESRNDTYPPQTSHSHSFSVSSNDGYS